MSTYATNVARDGLSASHLLLAQSIPDGSSVLDIGCSEGYLAERLGQRGSVVVGIELDAAAAQAARAHCSEVWSIDVEDAQARQAAGSGFDAVVLGDVLEHLRDPWDVIAWAASTVRPGGVVAISVPNAVHWSARREIARGRFPLRDWGTFDRTHLRWFTRAQARAMVQGAGLALERERFTAAPLPGEPALRRVLRRTDADEPPPVVARVRQALANRRPELFALQFVLTCRAK
jgi:methionine biosynthesis protein MetW